MVTILGRMVIDCRSDTRIFRSDVHMLYGQMVIDCIGQIYTFVGRMYTFVGLMVINCYRSDVHI